MSSYSEQTLAGKWAVVTGSSSGIGRAIAIELAAAGANLIVHGNRQSALADQLVTELKQGSMAAEVLLSDLSDTNAQQAFVESAWKIAPVDIWINNAGADVLTGEMANATFEEKLELLWSVDVCGTLALSRETGRRMKARGSGVILNMGWDQAEIGMAGDSGEMFATVKGAIMSFTKSLAKTLAPEVRVNCLAPGWIKTAWGAQASDSWQQHAKEDSLLQRWGTPEDVARAARYLASPSAGFVTGHILPINGGRP